MEIATTSMKLWAQDGQEVLQKPRGIYAPYRIRNRTGYPILVWPDDESGNSRDLAAVRVSNDQIVDWRFDDWRTTREVKKHLLDTTTLTTPW